MTLGHLQTAWLFSTSYLHNFALADFEGIIARSATQKKPKIKVGKDSRYPSSKKNVGPGTKNNFSFGRYCIGWQKGFSASALLIFFILHNE